MNQKNLQFLEYYNTKFPFEKEIIKDLLHDLIIETCNLLARKEVQLTHNNEKMIQLFMKELSQEDPMLMEGLSLLQSDGMIQCKKRNGFHKEVFKDWMIATEEVFWHIASLRRESMRLLDTLGIIVLKNDDPIELCMKSEEFKKLYRVDDQGKKKISMKELKTSNLWIDSNNIQEGSFIKKEDIQKFQELKNQLIDNLEYGFGEDLVNQNLNRDKSYHATMLFHWEKEDLEDLLEYLEQSKWKQIIKDVSFQNWELLINGRSCTISKSMSRDFLMLLVKFFEKNTHQNSVSVRELINFSETLSNLSFDKLQINTLTAGNIKNGYLKTITKNLGKKYANPKIFEMTGRTISNVLDKKR
jgi:hypothetical protein